MKRNGWLAIMFVGAIVVNGLILFMPPLVGAQEQRAEESGLSQQGEESGDMMEGKINSFDGEDTIVISDMTYHFSKRTRFYNKSGRYVPVSRLKVNDYVVFLSVDYVLEEVRQMDLKDVEAARQLHLQVGSEKEEGAVSEQNNGSQTPIRIEDGVWKN